MAISRRVRYIWALGTYTFSTTLMLMIMADLRYPHYAFADSMVSIGGGALMLLVGLGLVSLLRRGQHEYRGITMVFLMLCASQVAVALLHRRISPGMENLLGMGSWILFVLWLGWECRWMPKLNMNALTVAAAMMRDLTG